MEDNRKQIEAAFNAYIAEANNFWDKGNASAGTRARKNLMELKTLANEERTAIQDKKNAGK